MCVMRCFTMSRGRCPNCAGSASSASCRQILDRCLAKEPRDRYQKMEELRDDLRGVLQEVTSSETSGEPIYQCDSGTARHLSGENPVSRAMRWLEGAQSRSHFGARRGDTNQTDDSRDTFHHDCRSGKKESGDPAFRNLSQRSGVELLRILACRCCDHRTRARALAGGAAIFGDCEDIRAGKWIRAKSDRN